MTGPADPLDVISTVLRDAGVPAAELDVAREQGAEALLALTVDRLVVLGEERLDRHEVAARAGTEPERAQRFWRALGFVDVADDARMFTEVDAEMLASVQRYIDEGWVDEDLALQMTRVIGQSLSRVADAHEELVRDRGEQAREAGLPDMAVAGTFGTAAAQGLLTDLDEFVRYVWRRHLAAALERLALQAAGAGEEAVVVGFADLVGFTAISQELDDRGLAAAVSRFEATALDVIGSLEGRVVKMIGDEVMFAVPDPGAAAEVALTLVETFAADEALPDVRVGLARGRPVTFQGDLFGPPVNLAHRLVNIAYPASVVVSEDVAKALDGDDRYRVKGILTRRLKGLGRVRPWVLRRGRDGS